MHVFRTRNFERHRGQVSEGTPPKNGLKLAWHTCVDPSPKGQGDTGGTFLACVVSRWGLGFGENEPGASYLGLILPIITRYLRDLSTFVFLVVT
jgi:hypothetical protein